MEGKEKEETEVEEEAGFRHSSVNLYQSVRKAQTCDKMDFSSVNQNLLTLFSPNSLSASPDAFCRFTYEIAPVFVLMEQLTLKKMREIIGWPNGEGDGLFSPGKLAFPERGF